MFPVLYYVRETSRKLIPTLTIYLSVIILSPTGRNVCRAVSSHDRAKPGR